MKKGSLYLIATPISAEGQIHQQTKELLLKKIDEGALIVVEELKACRRRWLSWGLPRESIEHFEQYNEHNRLDQLDNFVSTLKRGRDICLMSDCGLPAFCDPGMRLVDRLHNENIRVTATAFDNSISLALALSGFEHDQFYFAGFLPKDKDQRKKLYKSIQNRGETTIIMDTPYRLTRVLEELAEEVEARKWTYCIATELGNPEELVIRGNIEKLIGKFRGQKLEFVIVVSPNYGRKSNNDKSQKRSPRSRT